MKSYATLPGNGSDRIDRLWKRMGEDRLEKGDVRVYGIGIREWELGCWYKIESGRISQSVHSSFCLTK